MKVHVGTYLKYNHGGLGGKWLDIEDYANKDEFLDACAELHKDEEDPEFMFQDWEDIPENMISESFIHENVFILPSAYEKHGKEAVNAYIAYFNEWDEEDFRSRYFGRYKSVGDFAEQLLEDTNGLNEVQENLRPYIDFTRYGKDMILNGDVVEHDDHYFWRY